MLISFKYVVKKLHCFKNVLGENSNPRNDNKLGTNNRSC